MNHIKTLLKKISKQKMLCCKTHSVWPRQKLCISCAPFKGSLGNMVTCKIEPRVGSNKMYFTNINQNSIRYLDSSNS